MEPLALSMHWLFILIVMSCGTTGVYIYEAEKKADCLSILDALPTYHWNNPDNFVSQKIDTIGDEPKASVERADRYRIRSYLFRKCMTRYQEISDQSARNYVIMKGYSNRSTKNAIPMDKKNLIVLDLDDTILDQHAMHRAEISISKDRLDLYCSSVNNERDLVFGTRANENSQNGKVDPHFIVYRPFLMEFIYKKQGSFNFVIYSLNDATNLIYHVVLIEMYYNFVFRMTRYRRAPEFKFNYVIGKVPHSILSQRLKHKSLLILDALIGDITRFESIHIVDSMAYSVWKNDFPSRLTMNSTRITKIFPFIASKFEIKINSANLEQERWMIHRQRNQDAFFKDLISSQGKLMNDDLLIGLRNGRLLWNSPMKLLSYVKGS